MSDLSCRPTPAWAQSAPRLTPGCSVVDSRWMVGPSVNRRSRSNRTIWSRLGSRGSLGKRALRLAAPSLRPALTSDVGAQCSIAWPPVHTITHLPPELYLDCGVPFTVRRTCHKAASRSHAAERTSASASFLNWVTIGHTCLCGTLCAVRVVALRMVGSCPVWSLLVPRRAGEHARRWSRPALASRDHRPRPRRLVSAAGSVLTCRPVPRAVTGAAPGPGPRG